MEIIFILLKAKCIIERTTIKYLIMYLITIKIM